MAWPGRGCIIGGRASDESVSYGNQAGNMQPGSIPTTTNADAIWTPNWAAYHLLNGFYGLEWPTLPDPNYANTVVVWHSNYKGTGQGNARMRPPSAQPVDCDGLMTSTKPATGYGQWPRRGGLYSLKCADATAGGATVTHNISNVINLGAGAFTCEGWLYCTDNTVQNSIWDFRGLSTANVQPLIYLNGTAPNVGKLTYNRGGGGGDLIIDAAVMSTNTWVHFALCRDSGTIYLYKNGVSVGSVVDGTNFTGASQVRIGFNAPLTVRFKGYLDEFRCTPGVARYPGGTTFTPDSAPYPDY